MILLALLNLAGRPLAREVESPLQHLRMSLHDLIHKSLATACPAIILQDFISKFSLPCRSQ